MASNGPLLELATFREYARPLRPKVILWLYFDGNDTGDLFTESQEPFLQKYLEEPGFSQNLLNNQEILDSFQTEYTNYLLRTYVSSKEAAGVKAFKEFVQLKNLQQLYQLTQNKTSPVEKTKPGFDRERLTQLLTMARNETEAWGGNFYIVYLPSQEHYFEDVDQPSNNLLYREAFLEMVEELQIPVIDIKKQFDAHPEPSALYTRHYSEEGYAVLSNAIIEVLMEDPLLASQK